MYTQDDRQLTVIYKFPVFPVVQLPKGSKVISVQSKEDGEFLYAQVPVGEKETETHFFRILATGDPFRPDGARYIGSFILADYYIYHVYEVSPESAERQAMEILDNWHPQTEAEDSELWDSSDDEKKAEENGLWDTLDIPDKSKDEKTCGKGEENGAV